MGALGTKGNTIAVLGTSLNNVYPKENIELFNSIIDKGGCIISENNDMQVELSEFPKRNRIISGISMATLVIEAAYRSGSSITAKESLKQGKKVFCIPRNLGDGKGVGVNNLITKGAEFVINSKQILEKLEIESNFIEEYNIDEVEKIMKKENKNIPDKYKKIYKAIENNTINVNDIAKTTGITIEKLNGILTLMEIDGYIKRLAGNEFVSI